MFRPLALALATMALSVADVTAAQTVVGPDSDQGRYNRLREFGSRAPSIFAPASPDILGTAAIGAGVTIYDARFRRVSNTDLDHPMVRDMAAQMVGLSPDQQLVQAQSLVRSRVRWMHDLDNMRVADFWSNAGETLERGTGDSEDIAIATMQLLKAAGFPARDLYLSIGRHRQAGQHIVLVASTPSGFRVLDDRVGHPVPATDINLFTPVLTVGLGKSWLHGRRIRGMTAHASAQ